MCALLLLAGLDLCRAAETDPFTVVEPQANLRALTVLRRALARAAPDDPRLLLAQMHLVDLALGGDLRDAGDRGGVWRRRARELRDIRLAAGARPADFAAAVPDLWVDALDGRGAAVVAALDGYGAAADNAQGRALRCMATGDWRPLRARDDLTVHERLALALAYCRAGMGTALERIDRDGLPALGFARLEASTVSFTHRGTAVGVSAALQQLAPLSASRSLPAAALGPRADFIAALGASPGAGPGELLAALAEDEHDGQGQVVLAGWRFAEAAAAGPTGVRGAAAGQAAGQVADQAADDWLLIGAGDWAAATRLELLLGVNQRHEFVRHQWGVPDSAEALSGALVAGDRGLLGAWQRYVVAEYNGHGPERAVLDAIDAELVRGPAGLPPMALAALAGQVFDHQSEPAALRVPLLRRLLLAQAAAEPLGSAGWVAVGAPLLTLDEVQSRVKPPPQIPPEVLAKIQARGRAAALAQVRVQAVARGLAPPAVEAEVQAASARLDRVPTRPAAPPPPPPADLLGAASGQLARAAAADPWSPELDRLAFLAAHPEHRRDPPGQDDEARWARLPWRVDLGVKRLVSLYDTHQWAAALAVAERIAAIDPANEEVGERHGQCLYQLERVDEAITVWEGYVASSSAFNVLVVEGCLGAAYEGTGRLAEAERHFAKGAASWQEEAMMKFAQFLVRRGRGREGAMWIDRCIKRYDETDLQPMAAGMLLTGTPAAAEVDDAFRRIAACSAQLPTSTVTWDIGAQVRRLGLQQRFIDLAQPAWDQAPGDARLHLLLGIMLVEAGHPAAAIPKLVAARHLRYSHPDAAGIATMWQELAARLAGLPARAPTPAELRAVMPSMMDPDAGHQGVMHFLLGDCDHATALAQAPNDTVRDAMRYPLGIAALARGATDEAAADLARVAAHPDWDAAGGARLLLAGISHSTPP